jgi:hypothetical protein
MSKLQPDLTQHQRVTPPSSFTHQPLTPPLTDRKPLAGARRVIALFSQIQAGTHPNQGSWTEFQLAQGEFDQIEDTLRQDSVLRGFVEDKIRLVNLQDREDHG